MVHEVDRRRSESRTFSGIIGQRHDCIWAVEVPGLGVLVFRSGTSDPVTGRLVVGVSMLTNQELQYDS